MNVGGLYDTSISYLQNAAAKAADEQSDEISLLTKINQLFANAIVFDPLLFQSTLASLYEKVAAYTG